MTIISPSILSADFNQLGADCRMVLDAGAQSVFAVALATVEFPQPVGSTTAIAENEKEI